MTRTPSSLTSPRRLVRALVVGFAGLALSACGAHPDAAAVVGEETISESRVDEVALALCSAQAASSQAGAPAELAGRAARQGALGVLLNSALSRQFGESIGLEPDQSQVSAAVTATQESIDALPRSRRSVFTETLRDYAGGQLVVASAGQRELTRKGAKNVTQQQALDAGIRLRDAWAKENVKVTVDPRYGRFSAGSLTFRSGSLSAPVSERAAAGAKQEPDASWVSALPASQKCS